MRTTRYRYYRLFEAQKISSYDIMNKSIHSKILILRKHESVYNICNRIT